MSFLYSIARHAATASALPKFVIPGSILNVTRYEDVNARNQPLGVHFERADGQMLYAGADTPVKCNEGQEFVIDRKRKMILKGQCIDDRVFANEVSGGWTNCSLPQWQGCFEKGTICYAKPRFYIAVGEFMREGLRKCLSESLNIAKVVQRTIHKVNSRINITSNPERTKFTSLTTTLASPKLFWDCLTTPLNVYACKLRPAITCPLNEAYDPSKIDCLRNHSKRHHWYSPLLSLIGSTLLAVIGIRYYCRSAWRNRGASPSHHNSSSIHSSGDHSQTLLGTISNLGSPLDHNPGPPDQAKSDPEYIPIPGTSASIPDASSHNLGSPPNHDPDHNLGLPPDHDPDQTQSDPETSSTSSSLFLSAGTRLIGSASGSV